MKGILTNSTKGSTLAVLIGCFSVSGHAQALNDPDAKSWARL